ncbi:MAG TPA: histidinol-phosphate transaminase [bacterium]|nr:histidinol-phosphate transaminase [bacterium]
MDRYFKRAVTALAGYEPPPQERVRAKLNQNESPFDLPEAFKKELLMEAAALPWNRYPASESGALKEALAARHGLRPGQILPGNGSNQLLQTLLAAVIEPGDGLLYFPPTFGLFELFATINGAQTTGILCPPDRPFPLEEALAAIRTGAPRLILLCSPDNPTGRALSRPEVEAICQAAPGLVFLDEAYAEFGGWSGLSLLEQYPGLVLSRTFSKAFSMAGLRLGYLISHPANIDQLRKAHLPYTVNLLTEHIALRLLADPGLLEERVAWIVREREWLLAEMRRIAAVTVYPSAANFLLFRCADGKSLFRRLKERGILVRDVSGYPLLENHLRVNTGSHDENLWFLEALKESLS